MARRLRGSSRVLGIRGQRRLTSWELGPGDCVETQFNGTGSNFIGMATTPTQDGLTLARIRGKIKAFLNSTNAIGGGMCGAFGIGIATAAAVAVGVTAVPTPITEQAWDGWLYWMPVQLFTTSATLTDGVNSFVSE